MRCRALARALYRRGAEIVFLCRPQPGDLTALLSQEFRVLLLPAFPPVPAGLEKDDLILSGRNLYSSWLGLPEEQDAKECLAVLLDQTQLPPPAWLVVDHYGLAACWQQWLLEGLQMAHGTAPKILVLDDLADRSHQASVLIDANRLDPIAANPYRDLLPGDCIPLLGPSYALLDLLYAELQPLVPSRVQIDRVLVFFGGTDAANYSAVALDALSHPQLRHLAVDVVLGTAAPHFVDLKRRVTQRPNTNLHVALPSLAGLIARADVALGAAGTASWERTCLGLPSLVVPVADNQVQGARALEAAGVARCLNLKAASDPVAILQEALLELLNAPDALQVMSKACLQLGDGRGVSRVTAALLGPRAELRLRSAGSADLWLYYWWASDPQVRSQSFNSDPFTPAQHCRWFTGRLSSPLALLLVLEDGDGLPLGQIRFERLTVADPRAVISFSLDRLARGRGLASLLLQLGLKELARRWGISSAPYGEVLAENLASCRAFLQAGFLEGLPPRPGVRCFASTAIVEP